jgi:hypothetical protein
VSENHLSSSSVTYSCKCLRVKDGGRAYEAVHFGGNWIPASSAMLADGGWLCEEKRRLGNNVPQPVNRHCNETINK